MTKKAITVEYYGFQTKPARSFVVVGPKFPALEYFPKSEYDVANLVTNESCLMVPI